MREKLREKFAGTFEKFGEFLHEHKDTADVVIQGVKTTYHNLNGEQKMEMAITLLLEQIHVPAPVAIYSSQKIVETVEKFLQARYDALKEADKV